jgi:putative membrane protein
MFTDYLAVMLVGLASGFVILAHYLYRNPEAGERQAWAAGFFAAGLLGLLTSVPMIVLWPLPGAYNIAFGEPALYLSVAFIGAGITLAVRWDPLIPAIYGFFGGLLAVVVGIRIANLGMTSEPALTAIGYISAGLGGMLTLPAINWRNARAIAIAAAVLLGVAAAVFLFIGYMGYWGHLAEFSKWVPNSMLQRTGK